MDHEKLKFEIAELTRELSKLGIAISDMVTESPKTKEELLECRKVIKYIADKPVYIEEILLSGELPVISIINELSADRKTLIEYKKYIITLSIICSRRYNSILEALGYKEGGI